MASDIKIIKTSAISFPQEDVVVVWARARHITGAGLAGGGITDVSVLVRLILQLAIISTFLRI